MSVLNAIRNKLVHRMFAVVKRETVQNFVFDVQPFKVLKELNSTSIFKFN